MFVWSVLALGRKGRKKEDKFGSTRFVGFAATKKWMPLLPPPSASFHFSRFPMQIQPNSFLFFPLMMQRWAEFNEEESGGGGHGGSGRRRGISQPQSLSLSSLPNPSLPPSLPLPLTFLPALVVFVTLRWPAADRHFLALLAFFKQTPVYSMSCASTSIGPAHFDLYHKINPLSTRAVPLSLSLLPSPSPPLPQVVCQEDVTFPFFLPSFQPPGKEAVAVAGCAVEL